jgi:predicted nucleic acid-binding protein
VSIALDTNVVLRLVTGRPEHQATAARALLEQLERIGATALVSDLVIAEAFYALRHHYRTPDSVALEQLTLLFEDPAVVGESAPAVLATLPFGDDPGFVDRLILQHARDRQHRLLTFDRALAALPDAARLEAV